MTEKDPPAPSAHEAEASSPMVRSQNVCQTLLGAAVTLLAILLAWGVVLLPEAQADDGGARLVPGLCAAALLLCGLWLLNDAWHGGWRHMPDTSRAQQMHITPWVWVTAAWLLCALLIHYSGFVVAAALCYLLALQGLRLAADPTYRVNIQRLLRDALMGVLLACIAYVALTHVLGVSLPAGRLSWN